MVRELAEFLLTTPKTHINCKSYNRFDENNQKRFEIFCRDYRTSNASNTGLAIQQSGVANRKTWATVAESPCFLKETCIISFLRNGYGLSARGSLDLTPSETQFSSSLHC